MRLWRRKGRGGADPEKSAASGNSDEAIALLGRRMERASTLARQRRRGVVAAVTFPVDAGIDPITHVESARRGSDPWSCVVQPARGRLSMASLGSAAEIRADGPGRFDSVAARCAELLEAAIIDDPFEDTSAPPGSGPLWIGGFAFLDEDSGSNTWADFPSMRLVLPSFSLVAGGGEERQARLTVSVLVEPESEPFDELRRIEGDLAQLRLDEDLVAPSTAAGGDPARVNSVHPEEHFERAVERATMDIAEGAYEKIVLARQVELLREQPIDPFNVLRGLTEAFPDCTTFGLGRGETTLLGSTPELLVRREGRRASTMALAGSTRRDSDPEVDSRLGTELMESAKNRSEHEIVVRRIERVLGRNAAWVSAPRQPELVKVKNIQHLATPIRAQLTEPRPVIELAGTLHPTPAVGGEPWDAVEARIGELEAFDRGWYAGGVGWMDSLEDGEFHVVLRTALVRGRGARLFAGCGIVGGSDPATELAETETKLQALLPILRTC